MAMARRLLSRESSRNLDNLDKLCEEGRLVEALDVMEQQGMGITRNNVYSILKLSCKMKERNYGRRTQFLMAQSGLDSISVLDDHLIRLFGACGSIVEANSAFTKVLQTTIYTWSAIVLANVDLGQAEAAVELYCRMKQSDSENDQHIYVSALKACSSASDLCQGRLVHNQIICSAHSPNVFVTSTLVDVYAKCGDLEKAIRLFENSPVHNVVLWGVMISGYVHNRCGLLALDCYEKMNQVGIEPDVVTLMSVLKACASVRMLERGRSIHSCITETQFHFHAYIGNALVDMYAKCGSLEEACKVFEELPNQNAVSWNAIIAGLAQRGEDIIALAYFDQMLQEGMSPDEITFSSILKACASIRAIERGRYIHEYVMGSKFQAAVFVGSTLVDMYAKCGRLSEALAVFDNLENRDVVTWGAMISGHAEYGDILSPVDCFDSMQKAGIMPDTVIFLAILKAFSSAGAMDRARHIHEQIIKKGFQFDAAVANALVDMYAKRGCLEEAHEVFQALPMRDAGLWNTIISGYVQHGDTFHALECFGKMQDERLRPDAAIFTAVLNACTHVGFVEEGREYFHLMRQFYMIEPDMYHCNCMVDLFARTGYFREAEDILCSTMQPNIIGWTSLLSACRLHSNMELGGRCFKEIIGIDLSSSAPYLIMSGIYAYAM